MKIICIQCKSELDLDLRQKLVSNGCEARVHFNIVEVICEECGKANFMSVSPKAVEVFNENLKMSQF